MVTTGVRADVARRVDALAAELESLGCAAVVMWYPGAAVIDPTAPVEVRVFVHLPAEPEL